MDISAYNRPNQATFAEVANKPPSGKEDEEGAKRVMAFKCPFAFEWPENNSWNAEQRLKQRISLESNKNPKIWDTPPGQAAKVVLTDLTKLNIDKWTKKQAIEILTNAIAKQDKRLSEKETILFLWMCFHVYVGGTPTSNPHKTVLFAYLKEAFNTSGEFLFDKLKGTGITGLYAACGYTKYVPDLHTWVDEQTRYITDMDPLLSQEHDWCATKRNSMAKKLVWAAAQMMNAQQQHHMDLRSALARTDREW